MTPAELKALIPILHTQKFAGQSDAALLALVRIYAALYNMVATNALDEEYGAREIYAKKLAALFDALCRRTAKQTNVAQRAELLYAMFYIVRGTTLGGDPKREERCFELANELLSDTLSGATIATLPLAASTYPLLKCLAVYLYPCPAEDDPWLLIFKQQISAWASELDATGHWPQLSTAEALQRLILLSMHSYMFLDESHDDAIRLAHTAYCTLASIDKQAATGVAENGVAEVWATLSTHPAGHATTHLSPESLHLCNLLYEAAMQGAVYLVDKQLSNDIADLLDRSQLLDHQNSHQHVHCPTDSDETLFCLGITTDNLCTRITDAAQEEMMEKIQTKL
ncbi:MAG: hypothetical protein RRY33_09205 [Alistipes sp.]